MGLPIPRNAKLSPEEAAVEAEFSAAIQADPDAFVERYRARFGRTIDTDRARELCPAYCESDAARTCWSRAVYNPAKALADEVYLRTVGQAAPVGGWKIMFTSGGTGVGKSTALAELSDDPASAMNCDLLVDGTLSDFVAARAKIQLALELGHRVTVVHVHRAFPETIRMVVRRALEQGRVVTLDNIAVTHFRSRETLFKLVEEFGGQIAVRVLENKGAEDAGGITLSALAAMPGKTIDELRTLAHALFGEEYASLETSHPAIHRAFLQAGSRR